MSSSDRQRLDRRFQKLRHTLPGQSEPLFAAVYCNDCGRIEAAATLELLLHKIDGWLIGNDFASDDLCPGCRPHDEHWAGSFPKPRVTKEA